jgi:hypothetical protein
MSSTWSKSTSMIEICKTLVHGLHILTRWHVTSKILLRMLSNNLISQFVT